MGAGLWSWTSTWSWYRSRKSVVLFTAMVITTCAHLFLSLNWTEWNEIVHSKLSGIWPVVNLSITNGNRFKNLDQKHINDTNSPQHYQLQVYQQQYQQPQTLQQIRHGKQRQQRKQLIMNENTLLTNKSTLTFENDNFNLLSDAEFKELLNFSTNTTLNFMHMHKTGGSAIKLAFYAAYYNRRLILKSTNEQDMQPPDAPRHRQSGRFLHIEGSCHIRPKDGPSISQYVCSWEDLARESLAKRQTVDIAMGHQFLHGKESLSSLLPTRDVRIWTVLRHPFERKLSCFFHFMRRQFNASETASLETISAFLINEEGEKPGEGMKLDAGPNYLAGRLLSTGYDDFTMDTDHRHAWYETSQSSVQEGIDILNGFVMIGLQHQQTATKCMMNRMLSVFDSEIGINLSDSGSGARKFAQSLQTENVGTYGVHAKELWKALSNEQQERFRQRERVDLEIYKHGRKLFRKQAVQFGCVDYVEVEEEWFH